MELRRAINEVQRVINGRTIGDSLFDSEINGIIDAVINALPNPETIKQMAGSEGQARGFYHGTTSYYYKMLAILEQAKTEVTK